MTYIPQMAIDPALTKAIKSAKSANRPVHAAFTLDDQDGKMLSPEATDRVVDELVRRASADASAKPEHVVVFRNLQSFAVNGPAPLIERLAKDSAVRTSALGS